MPGLWDLSSQIRAQADRFLAKHEPPSADFSRVATEILQSFPAQEFSFEDLCDKRLWLERDQNHKSSTFSDISLTLWRAPTYFLDFYFWVDRSTSIHDHNFSGGFRVMRGHYLQTSYRFQPGEEAFTGINRGQLKPLKTTSLRSGDALPIHDGDGLIHQTFHGEAPCVTLCLRSPNTAPFLHSYLTTGWRICMQRPTGTTRQRINFIKALARQNDWRALEDEVKLIPLDVALAATIQDPSVKSEGLVRKISWSQGTGKRRDKWHCDDFSHQKITPVERNQHIIVAKNQPTTYRHTCSGISGP